MSMEDESKKGSRLLKALGIITVVGILFALGRYLLKFFRDDEGAGEERASS